MTTSFSRFHPSLHSVSHLLLGLSLLLPILSNAQSEEDRLLQEWYDTLNEIDSLEHIIDTRSLGAWCYPSQYAEWTTEQLELAHWDSALTLIPILSDIEENQELKMLVFGIGCWSYVLDSIAFVKENGRYYTLIHGDRFQLTLEEVAKIDRSYQFLLDGNWGHSTYSEQVLVQYGLNAIRFRMDTSFLALLVQAIPELQEYFRNS
ncbi:hypothetical protein [Sanyastnella coralliicola]|uniref:hypothetical protein n=1 Tax=Sanyastnella coralliicola TaxID=3069118 RepID=UPI0027B8EFD4|nr:hypothetical protein [Longitalea sp. SCSIO 12813]